MTRFLTLFALVGLLAACTGQGDTTTDAPDGESSPGMTGSPVATSDATDDAAGTAGTASAECTAAFDGLAAMNVQRVSELGDLPDEVEPTIEACVSVDEWLAGAQEVVADEINPNTARLLLGIQCNQPSLSSSDLCRDLASS